MENIKNLIQQNKIQQAANLLIELAKEDRDNAQVASSIAARVSALKMSETLGVLNFSEISVERNKINYAILALLEKINVNSQQVQEPKIGEFNQENVLSQMIITNKRKYPEIAEKAVIIQQKLNQYKLDKLNNGSFDITGRKIKAINEEINLLQKEIAEKQELSLEQIVERIYKLIEPTIPSYTNLQEAYHLSNGRGFKDNWIEQQLQNRTEDDNIKISIAEKIELFISS